MAFAVASVMATAEAPAVQAKDPKAETLTSENASTTMADEDTGPADDVLPLADEATVQTEKSQAEEIASPEDGGIDGPVGAVPDLADRTSVQTEANQAEDDAPAKTTTRKSRSPLRAQEICALTPGRRCRNMTETTRLANVATSTVASSAASAWRP